MDFARKYHAWYRGFRTFRWHYNFRHVNIENGKNAYAQLHALSTLIDYKKPSCIEPNENGAADSHLASINPNNTQSNVYEEKIMPADLNEMRQAYEAKVIEDIERFRSRTEKNFSTLEFVCEKGITNIGLLRHDLFSFLRTHAIFLRYKLLIWILFFIGLVVLAALDIAPTLLVFEGIMNTDKISIGSGFGFDPKGIRDVILLCATSGFLVGIVMMGHVVAKLIAATYLDGEVPVFGIGLALITVALFITIAGLRYYGEIDSLHNQYNTYSNNLIVQDVTQQVANNTTLMPSPSLSFEDWSKGHGGKWLAIFRSSMFVLISIMIFISAIYLSLWKAYGDIRMITRRFKHIRYRIKAATLAAKLRSEHNALTNNWEKLRQSAQVEVEQFMCGIEKAMSEQNLAVEDRLRMQFIMRDVAYLFNCHMRLPEIYQNKNQVMLPATEEEWGMRYVVFLTESIFFEAFAKGAIDAFNHGKKNINSTVGAITGHFFVGAHEEASARISDDKITSQYYSGFIEGSNILGSPSSALSQNERDEQS